MSDLSVFSSLSPSLKEHLAALSIVSPTGVQKRVIPVISSGTNVLFQSETGTGKTFAYLLPLIEKIEAAPDPEKRIRLFICAPTLELASQIRTAAQTVSELKCALLTGGSPLQRQIETLKEKPVIAVGTAARMVELIRLKKIKTGAAVAVVFDEIDRLVKKELSGDVSDLIAALPSDVQKIGCSATLSSAARSFLAPAEVVVMPPEDVLRLSITHYAIHAETRDKIDTLRSLLAALTPAKALVFASRPDQVENIASKLAYKKVDCAALFAKEDKQARKAALDRFRSGKCPVLITSDLAARGLDIPGITHIIQMDLPDDSDFFVHRAGRTARAGNKGVNIVIGDEFEMRRYAAFEKKLHIIVYPKALYNGKLVAADEAGS